MAETQVESRSFPQRIVDIVLLIVGVLIAGRYVLGYPWPVWQENPGLDWDRCVRVSYHMGTMDLA